MLFPLAVRLTEPVEALLRPATKLSTLMSTLTPLVRLPIPIPTLTCADLLSCTERDDRQISDVQDIHSVCPQAVLPNRAAGVAKTCPIRPPSSKTIAEPVAQEFVRTAELAKWLEPHERAFVTLPTRLPAVMTTLRLADTFNATRHSSEESDAHRLDWQEECEFRPVLRASNPKLEPNTETTAGPLIATFGPRTVDTPPCDIDQTLLTLPSIRPTVIDNRWL